MKAMIKSHPGWTYAILACAISWLVQLPGLIALQGDYRFTARFLVLLNISSYGPSLAAIAVTGLTQGRAAVKALLKRVLQWRVSWLVYLATFFVFPVIFFIGYRLSGIRAVDGETLLVFLTLVTAAPLNALVGSVILGIGPLGEELGWRGFMLPHLLERHGEVASSVILGLVWAFWHLPLFLFAEWRGEIPVVLAISLYPFTTIATAYAMTKLHHWGGGSVLLAILYHGIVNYVADSQDFWQIESLSPVWIQILLTSLFLLAAFVFWLLSKTAFFKSIAKEQAPHAKRSLPQDVRL